MISQGGARPPTAPVVAAGLIGGYAAARHAGRSDLATVVFTGAGAWCTRSWLRASGRRVTAILLGTYLVTFWASHPLARKIGAWPSVLAMAAVAAGTTAVLADDHRQRGTLSSALRASPAEKLL